MKCGRCHKDVPVLTPSPEGDLDLCGDCYAAVYAQLHAARGFPKGPLIAAIVAALVVVVAVYIVLSGRKADDSAALPPPKTETSALVGPNRPDPRKAQPKKTATKPPKETVQPAGSPPKPAEGETPAKGEPAKTAEETSETPTETKTGETTEQPAEAKTEETTEPKPAETPAKEAEPPPRTTSIEAASFVLTAGGAHQTGQASVSIRGADGQMTTQQIPVPEEETLYEVSLTLTPTAENEVVVAGLALRVGETPFGPIQARLFGGPYMAPSDTSLLLSESATIIVSFGAEEDTVGVSERGDELVATRKEKPASIPLTVLFALPKDVDTSGGAAVVLPEGEVAISLK